MVISADVDGCNYEAICAVNSDVISPLLVLIVEEDETFCWWSRRDWKGGDGAHTRSSVYFLVHLVGKSQLRVSKALFHLRPMR